MFLKWRQVTGVILEYQLPARILLHLLHEQSMLSPRIYKYCCSCSLYDIFSYFKFSCLPITVYQACNDTRTLRTPAHALAIDMTLHSNSHTVYQCTQDLTHPTTLPLKPAHPHTQHSNQHHSTRTTALTTQPHSTTARCSIVLTFRNASCCRQLMTACRSMSGSGSSRSSAFCRSISAV